MVTTLAVYIHARTLLRIRDNPYGFPTVLLLLSPTLHHPCVCPYQASALPPAACTKQLNKMYAQLAAVLALVLGTAAQHCPLASRGVNTQDHLIPDFNYAPRESLQKYTAAKADLLTLMTDSQDF